MKPVTKLLLTAVASALLGAVLYVGYLRYWSEHVLNRALEAVVAQSDLPPGVTPDTLGMQVQLQDTTEFASLLRTGYSVSQVDLWSFLELRGVGFALTLQPDIGLVCEVYDRDGWEIFCGQIHCALKPCVFTARPDHSAALQRNPKPNNTLNTDHQQASACRSAPRVRGAGGLA